MPDESSAPLFTPEWVAQFTTRYGFAPIAGGSEEAGSGEDTPTPEASGPETEVGTPAPGSDEQTVDYEKRYNDLRSDYDRKNQRLSELEGFFGALTTEETQAQALAALGIDYEEVEDDDEDFDELDPVERIERVEARLAEKEQQEQHAKVVALEKEYVAESISEITKAKSLELSDKERQVVETLADRMRDEEGIPDVEAAIETFQAAAEANLGRYRESKKAPMVELGQAGTEKIDLSDEDARIEATAAIIEAARQAEQV